MSSIRYYKINGIPLGDDRLETELAKKANVNGDKTVPFNVKDAELSTEAVSKSQLDNTVGNINALLETI